MHVFMRRNPTRAFLIVLLLFVVSILSGGALLAASPPYCASLPRLQWLSAAEVETLLKARGLNLVKLRLADDKCYRVVVRDAGGRLHDFLMHPVTAEIVRERDL